MSYHFLIRLPFYFEKKYICKVAKDFFIYSILLWKVCVIMIPVLVMNVGEYCSTGCHLSQNNYHVNPEKPIGLL